MSACGLFGTCNSGGFGLFGNNPMPGPEPEPRNQIEKDDDKTVTLKKGGFDYSKCGFDYSKCGFGNTSNINKNSSDGWVSTGFWRFNSGN